MRSCLRVLCLLVVLAGFGLAACSKSTKPATGTLQVRLTDAPGNVDAVHLVIREVSVHADGPDSIGGWSAVQSEPKTFDLLTLRNGVFVGLGSVTLTAGKYTQIRLILDPGSDIVVDGVTHPLVVPSGLQTGLKLVGTFDVLPDVVTDVLLDFDALHSVVLSGSGDYVLKPVVRETTTRAQ